MGNDQPNIPRSEITTADEDRNEDQTAYETSGSSQGDNASVPGEDGGDLDDDELTYDPQEVEAPATTTKPEPEPKRTEKTSGSTSSTPKSKPIASSTSTPKGGTPTRYNSSGAFMVVAGSFSQRHNAEVQVKKLKNLGYKNARVEIFNGGSLATALVDRYDDYDRAKRLVTELKGKGVDCFVKKKQ